MAESRHTLPRAPSAQHHRMIHPWLTAKAFAKLALEAERRKLHPERFAADLFEIIARDDMFAAIVDE